MTFTTPEQGKATKPVRAILRQLQSTHDQIMLLKTRRQFLVEQLRSRRAEVEAEITMLQEALIEM